MQTINVNIGSSVAAASIGIVLGTDGNLYCTFPTTDP